jgi:hypothetical protein
MLILIYSKNSDGTRKTRKLSASRNFCQTFRGSLFHFVANSLEDITYSTPNESMMGKPVSTNPDGTILNSMIWFSPVIGDNTWWKYINLKKIEYDTDSSDDDEKEDEEEEALLSEWMSMLKEDRELLMAPSMSKEKLERLEALENKNKTKLVDPEVSGNCIGADINIVWPLDGSFPEPSQECVLGLKFKDFDVFQETYGMSPEFPGHLINWEKVGKDYGGVAIPYAAEARTMSNMFKYGWYNAWDVSSCVVWSRGAIKGMEILKY